MTKDLIDSHCSNVYIQYIQDTLLYLPSLYLRVANSQMKFFSRVFQGTFCKISMVFRGFLSMFSKNMIITYRSACTYTPFILHFT